MTAATGPTLSSMIAATISIIKAIAKIVTPMPMYLPVFFSFGSTTTWPSPRLVSEFWRLTGPVAAI